MLDISNVKEISWKENGVTIRQFEPEFNEPNLATLAQLLKVISRNVDFFLLNDIKRLCEASNKELHSDENWGIWIDVLNDGEKSLPIYLREETGFHLGEIATVFNGDHLPYVFYRPKDNKIFIIDYYKEIPRPIELSLEKMEAVLICCKIR